MPFLTVFVLVVGLPTLAVLFLTACERMARHDRELEAAAARRAGLTVQRWQAKQDRAAAIARRVQG